VTELGAFEGKFADSMSFETIVEHVASVARRHHTSRVFGDQYLAFALQSEFAKHGLAFAERAWSQPSKIEALATLRRMARERSIVLPVGPEGDACRRELLSLREVLLPSKVFTVQSRRTGRGHADRANLVLLLARLVAEGDVWGAKSPLPNGPRDASRFMPIRSQFGRGAGTTMEPPRNQAQLQPSRGAFSWTPNNRRKSPFQNW
jgi:hypothetical protein